MIEPLADEGPYTQNLLRAKINELIEAFNNHHHMTVDSETQSIGDYDKGFRSSSPRINTQSESP